MKPPAAGVSLFLYLSWYSIAMRNSSSISVKQPSLKKVHDELLPFMFTAGALAGSHPLLARIKGDWGGSARAQGGPQEASDGFWRSELCDRPPTPKRLSAGRSYSQDLW